MIYNTLFAVSKVVYFSMALWYILTWLFTVLTQKSATYFRKLLIFIVL